MLKFRNTTEQFQRVLIQSSIHSFNGKGQEQMCMTAFKTPIKKQNLDFLERLLLKLERISSQRAINKLLKVFGKIATFKMKILMIFRKLMPPLHMLLILYNNTKNLKQLKIMILMISLPPNIGKTTIYTMVKIF